MDASNRREKLIWSAAWLAWIGTYVVLIALWIAGRVHSISYDVYADAASRFLTRQPLYDTTTIEGFQYFPQSAVLVAPLSMLGSPIGDIVWRAFGWSLLALGVYRLVDRLTEDRRAVAFFVSSVAAILLGVGALGNGQANLIMAALGLHAVAEIGQRHWWRAAFVLGLGLALKPLMAVLLLLAWAIYRPLWWRMPLVIVGLALLPWLFADHGYVWDQHLMCFEKLASSSTPAPAYEDLRGLLGTVGWTVPHSVATVARAIGALFVLWICVQIRRRFQDAEAIIFMAAMAAAYLMLFNPRTQSTTYAVPGAVNAVLIGLYLGDGRWRALVITIAVQVLWMVNYHWVPAIELWLKPLVCLGFLTFLLVEVARVPRGWSVAPHYSATRS